MANTDIERRDIPCEIEFREDGETATISGVAAVFDAETTIGSKPFGFRETIATSAFDAALERPDDVRALFNHDPNHLLGRTKNDTLKLTKTPEGLRYEVDLPNTASANDVRELIKRGDVTGSSFGFRVTADEWKEGEGDDLDLRTVTAVELWDVSPVTYPAYPQTSVSARSKVESLVEARKVREAETQAQSLEAREALREQVRVAKLVDLREAIEIARQ